MIRFEKGPLSVNSDFAILATTASLAPVHSPMLGEVFSYLPFLMFF